MEIRYGKQYSNHLGREMEYKIYGSGGKPALVIPCQSGRFYEFEDMHMLDVYAPFIDDGRLQVFTIDSMDSETLFGPGAPRPRIERHEAWINYIVKEAIPHFSSINAYADVREIRFLVSGLSLGSLHAATLYFRYPDVFDALMALSGVYTNEYCFGDYHDDLTYMNSPEQFIAGMQRSHPYIQKYNRGRAVLCVGQGEWENETLESTRRFGHILEDKGIMAWVDIWGKDVRHDWDWWYIQAAYFLPELLKG